MQLQAREVETAELRKLLGAARGSERDELRTLREMNAELMGRAADQQEALSKLESELRALQHTATEESAARELALAETDQLRAVNETLAQV